MSRSASAMVLRHLRSTWGAHRSAMARVLVAEDLPEARALCAIDPVASTLASARLAVADQAGFAAAGGQVWGFPERGSLEAVCWAGANLVPVMGPGLDERGRRAAVAGFAELALRYGRRSSSIVGDQKATLGMWELLAARWPAARDIRANQPSLAIDRTPDVAPDPLVRRSLPAELDLVFPACVAMFTEEVGYSPVAGSSRAYRARVRSLVEGGRSFVRIEPSPPAVVFKAELGAVTDAVAQVQGVWVDPAHRGQGRSEPGMAAVVVAARRDVAPIVSLYVNDFNTRALATYRRVGFEQVGTYATVLF